MSSSSSSFVDFEDSEVGDQFYDAIAAEPSEDEDSDDDEEQSLVISPLILTPLL